MKKVDKRQIAYTAYAPEYDARRFTGRFNEYAEGVRIRAILGALGGVKTDAQVLDVGCGTGRGAMALARAGFSRITALDFTEAMLAIARDKQQRLDAPDAVRLVRGDAFALPFADETFDRVLSLNFLHMFRFSLQQDIVAELTRVCRRGGLVIAELQSIHKGLFVSRYPEQWRVRDHQKFNSIREVHQLFPRRRFAERRVIGTVLPKLYRLFAYAPDIGARVESISHVTPFNWLSSQVVVRARRSS
jgi:ubiquinone/menaquinone biosynthesis C-methylase UbiE